jgi:hypothetical protein
MIVNLCAYREKRYAKARPWSSLDDLPDVCPEVQAMVWEIIFGNQAVPVAPRPDSQWTPRLVDL